MLEPSDKVKERINSLSLPENYTALQVRNAPDWDDYGRNENLQLFLDEIKTFPKDTIFYLSAMNKDISDFIKIILIIKYVNSLRKTINQCMMLLQICT